MAVRPTFQRETSSDWGRRITDPAVALGLPARHPAAVEARRVAAVYPMAATAYYLSLGNAFDRDDPILRQCVPSVEELDVGNGHDEDPLSEEAQSPVPGLVHRYKDRVLLVVTNKCAVHCRHCLRKRLWKSPPYALTDAQLDRAFAYIARTEDVREVIVSGGDPLILPPAYLSSLLARLQRLKNVETVRIGSRVPVVLPQRLTEDFCRELGKFPPVWLITHFNHPRELTEEAAQACENLLRAGIPVLNQSVLLKGINDSVETMSDLFRGLVHMRVKPYYLFHGDPVAGTMHFRTGIAKGLQIMAGLRESVSGMAQPVFALDLPDGGGKVRLSPNVCTGSTPDGSPIFRGISGREISYPDPVDY
ncbi:MAG: KamA family radical SAM protein [Candidatus Pacebacteria bacterium]|nr:KamA family radical SAM protein [Candidatus Paceibacterota bacterium]